MSEKKPEVPDTKIKEPNFIKFSNVQRNYLSEVIVRQRREFNEAIQEVYEELGIVEKILQAPPGKYKLRRDFSGLDVLPLPESPKDPLAEDPKDIKPPEKET